MNSTAPAVQLRNLYHYLITKQPANVSGWLEGYRAFTADIDKVRAALAAGSPITADETYRDTRWAGADKGWTGFANDLMRSTENRVSGRGQSMLSEGNFGNFLEAESFIGKLRALLISPTKENFEDFEREWRQQAKANSAYMNTLLVNRVLASCTRDVSSTVNVMNLATVYAWLARKGLLGADYVREDSWYDKNIHLMQRLRQAFADQAPEDRPDDHQLSVFVWELFEYISTPSPLLKQLIKYGSPGTGKTWAAKTESEWQFTLWKDEFGVKSSLEFADCHDVVQFHPSYGYEDFMEGLRPVKGNDGRIQLSLANGIFKRLCVKAGKWECDVHAIPGAGPQLAKNWANLTIGDLLPHAGYLRGEHWHILGFDAGCKVTEAVPPYFIIIDEINRAELSRVLGELMLCLEYRGTGGAISTQYAALNCERTGMLKSGHEYRFFVPHNVHVVGTMNTIDRSIESFDLALRRRFRWERVDPNMDVLRHYLRTTHRKWLKLADHLKALNDEIEANKALGPDFRIGQAYLMNLNYAPTVELPELKKRVWADHIKPLLEEYLRGLGDANATLKNFGKTFDVK